MSDKNKTKAQLLAELQTLRQELAHLQTRATEQDHANAPLSETEVQRQNAEQLETPQNITLELVALRGQEELLQLIVEQAICLLHAQTGGIHLYRPKRQILEWTIHVGHNPKPAAFTLKRGEGMAGAIWATGAPLRIDDYNQWPGRASSAPDTRWAAAVGVPIQWKDEFLGVLLIADTPPRLRSGHFC